jgi:hypothetical protein
MDAEELRLLDWELEVGRMIVPSNESRPRLPHRVELLEIEKSRCSAKGVVLRQIRQWARMLEVGIRTSRRSRPAQPRLVRLARP